MPKRESPLRIARRARSLNQQQMAMLLKLSQQTYSKYESGLIVPPAYRQSQIATLLGAAVEELWPAPLKAMSA